MALPSNYPRAAHWVPTVQADVRKRVANVLTCIEKGPPLPEPAGPRRSRAPALVTSLPGKGWARLARPSPARLRSAPAAQHIRCRALADRAGALHGHYAAYGHRAF